ncbi:MAG: nucleotidyltransferase domain-containing protein [Verrucomicrobiota bacterium]|nr:nucleotidyltransferase domain-containing protein [Verrucomicrobiota bacterium]
MKTFSVSELSENLQEADEVDFAYLFGSAVNGTIREGSDIDVGVFLNSKFDLNLLAKLATLVENSTEGECDLSILNTASSILGMEALKGKLLFVREQKREEYADFYVRICQEYEDDMFDLERNLKYRG